MSDTQHKIDIETADMAAYLRAAGWTATKRGNWYHPVMAPEKQNYWPLPLGQAMVYQRNWEASVAHVRAAGLTA